MERHVGAITALVVFGISFGYVEAAVVVYLRAIQEPIRQEVFGDEGADDLFPLLTVKQLEAAGQRHVLLVELGRELATLVMLAGAGWAVARNVRQWLAGFMIAFGVWDVFYYVFLKLLIGWPASLGTWDILFLLPVPWVGPVMSPVIVSVAMIVAGIVILRRESSGRPIAFRWFHWVAIVGGGLVVIVAFCWDCRNTMAGEWPSPFNWPLFSLGMGFGLAAFVHALWARSAA
ncbi:MAG: hypothetical protein ACYTG0_35600 [Planctomycetota bacterium]|jgi:hypothetical protein